MAGNGPAPAARRRRNNADTYAEVQATVGAEDVQLPRGPSLMGRWSEDTRSWYETWRRAPQSEVFVSTDWQRLQMMVPLVERYFEKPHHLVMAEIRLNESLLGATHVDRLKGRIKVEREAPAVASPGVAALNDYRSRLAG